YAVDYGPDGSVYIAGYSLFRVRPDGIIEKLRFYIDGVTADFHIYDIRVDSAGCLYFPAEHKILKATPRR
ncbi:MAG: hypothetical protein JXM71_10595, partial [Spirochaetales bacterium]|nr:hypothetical protein [Spirochaetales bacterium]